MIHAPLEFRGPWSKLYWEHIEPNLPSVSSVDECHKWMIRYSMERDSVFPVRAAGSAQRRRVYSTCDGTRIAPADNSPAWAFHALLINKAMRSYEDFKRHVLGLPAHFFDVRGRTINRYRWYVAHIYPAKNGNTAFRTWDRIEVVRRFFLAVHPCNLFFVPLPNRLDGEDPRVIGFIAGQYSKRYGTTWTDFVRCVRGAPLPRVSGFGSQSVSVDLSRLVVRTSNDATVGVRTSAHKGDRERRGASSYSASRLTFKSRVIEPLGLDDIFEVITPVGVFKLTKRDFCSEFDNVIRSRSYRLRGNYNYRAVPKKAERFRVTYNVKG